MSLRSNALARDIEALISGAPAPVLTRLRVGDRVLITPKDEFSAYLDGWRGTVTGFEAGSVWVSCFDEGITKRFLLPESDLTLTA